MNELINKIGERMVIKMRVVNIARREIKGSFYEDNIRKNPFYSEFYGMTEMLKAMDIDFEIDWNDNDVYEMTAITIMGKRFEV